MASGKMDNKKDKLFACSFCTLRRLSQFRLHFLFLFGAPTFKWTLYSGRLLCLTFPSSTTQGKDTFPCTVPLCQTEKGQREREAHGLPCTLLSTVIRKSSKWTSLHCSLVISSLQSHHYGALFLFSTLVISISLYLQTYLNHFTFSV